MELIDEAQQYENHFIGSIVSIPVNANPTGVQQFVVIDGQQRLTTLLVLLSVIRDKAEEDGLPELAAEINETMLVNRFKKVKSILSCYQHKWIKMSSKEL